jgi:hypothetical protein
MEAESPYTHVLWLQLWQRGKFRGWYKAGVGRLEMDADGNVTVVHNHQHMTTLGGWNGYSQLLPIGVMPENPQAQPKRPTPGDDEDDELQQS